MNEVDKFAYNFTESELGITLTGNNIVEVKPGESVNIENQRRTIVDRYIRSGAMTCKNPNMVEVNYVVNCSDVSQSGGRYNDQDVGKIGSSIFWRSDSGIGAAAQVYINFYDSRHLSGDLPGIVLQYPESLSSLVTSTVTTDGDDDPYWPSTARIPGRPFQPSTYFSGPPPLPSSRKKVDELTWATVDSPEWMTLTFSLPGKVDPVTLVGSKLLNQDEVIHSYLMPSTMDWVNDQVGDHYYYQYEPNLPPASKCAPPVSPVMTCGAISALVMTQDGTVWGWGANYYRQLGVLPITDLNPTGLNPVSSPINLSLYDSIFKSNFRSISGTHHHFAAATKGGQLVMWGSNSSGQCAREGIPGSYCEPAYVSETLEPLQHSGAFLGTACGFSHTLAYDFLGQVFSCGDNTYGQLGSSGVDSRFTLNLITYEQRLEGSSWVTYNNFNYVNSVACGHVHSVASKNGSTLNPRPLSVFGWGDNTYGQLGIGTTGGYETTPKEAWLDAEGNAIDNVIQVACGDNFTLLLRSEAMGLNSVWVSGASKVNQVTVVDPDNPPTVNVFTRIMRDISNPLDNIKAIAAGFEFAMALDHTGKIWAWGKNDYGQLGTGDEVDSYYPQIVKSDSVYDFTGVTAIASGAWFSMARKVDGSIWTWGGDDYGQLGNGAVTVENQFYPARVNQFVINNLENVYNTCAVFDELSINEEDYYDSATGMSTFKVWMKVVSTYFPTPQTGFIFKDWTLLTPEINPRKRVKEIIRGVYEPLL